MSKSKLVLTLFAILVSAIVYLALDYIYFSITYFGHYWKPGVNYIPFRGLIFFISMLFGMISSHLTEEIKYSGKKVTILKIVRQLPYTKRFWISLLVTPIVYSSVYVVTKTQLDNTISIMLSFQNGYFWESVINRVRFEITQPTK